MAVQTILDGPKNIIVKIVGVAAGAELAVDVSALEPPCDEVRITKIWYDLGPATSASIDWVATADLPAWICHDHAETMCFQFFGGLVNNAGAGKNGDVEVNVTGTGGHSIVLYCEKVRPVFPSPN